MSTCGFGRALALAVCGVAGLVAGATEPGQAPGTGAPATAAAIDALLAAVYPPTQPGAVALVSRDGRVLLRKGYGLASVELGVAMRPETVMPVASLGKAFTAAGILALAEGGQLSLHDDITRFLPSYPVRGQHITIEHLLTHTSGISSLAETPDLRASAVQDAPVVDVLREWVRDLPPDAPPGERWAYSNWGYNLLAAIIERASGQSYQEVLQRRFFDPLGMKQTFYMDRRRVIAGRAAGYDAQEGDLFNALPPRSRVLQPNGGAGWLSTVDDLAKWSESLDEARVLTRASIQAMFTPYRLNDGSSTGYGYGWDLGVYAGHQVQEHQGGTPGFAAHIVRIPDARVFVAILSNRSSGPVPLQATAHRVAAMALGRPIPDPIAVPVGRRTLEALAGTYRGGDVGTCAITWDDGALAAQVPGVGRMPLVPVGGTTFRTPVVTWTFTFETDAEGRGIRLRVRDWKLNDVAERFSAPVVAPPSIVPASEADLGACVGTYESLSGVLVTVEQVGDHLAVRPFAQPAAEVFPTGPLVFSTNDGTVEYRFTKTTSGAVAGYQRTAGGTPVPARRLR